MNYTPQTQALQSLFSELVHKQFSKPYGVLTEISQIKANVACRGLKLGDICAIKRTDSGDDLLAEVIAATSKSATLTLFGDSAGLGIGALLERHGDGIDFTFGDHLLGAVLDGLGRPIELTSPQQDTVLQPAKSAPPDPMDRPLIDTPLQTGLRCIDGLLSLGRGQRIGIFGPAGTGKSSLLASIGSQTDADVIVIGLVGERGREVREFLQRHLPAEKRDRIVVVAATSDRPPMERIYAAHVATAVAEGFRDQGKSVLLMIDSLTRVARAYREIGLAAGEPPTRRGYPASVYPALPALIERSGRTEKGDITALYTVLVEGDGTTDPIAEEARSLTDGHIELCPKLAGAGHYPAIDILRSLSRVMKDIVKPEQTKAADTVRGLMKKYLEIEMLVQIGEYSKGQDPKADRALAAHPQILSFLQQGADDTAPFQNTISQLKGLAK